MKRFESFGALAAFVFAFCLLAAPAFAKETVQNKKPVSVLVEELGSSDSLTRAFADQELKKRDLSDEEVKFLATFLVDTISGVSYQVLDILRQIPPEKREVLYSIYKQAADYKKDLLIRLFATLPKNKNPREGVEFLMKQYHVASFPERKEILNALGDSHNFVYEDIRPVFLSENEAEHHLVYYRDYSFNLLRSFYNDEIRDVLYRRMMTQPGRNGDYAQRVFSKKLNRNFESSYEFIKSKLNDADSFVRIRMMHLLTLGREVNTDLFMYMVNRADGRSKSNAAERALATDWLRTKRNWNDVRSEINTIKFFKTYHASENPAVSEKAIDFGCRDSKAFYDVLYKHLQKFHGDYAVFRCLSKLNFDEANARRFYPLAVNNEKSYYTGLLAKEKYKTIIFEELRKAIHSQDETLRRNAFLFYLEFSSNDPGFVMRHFSEIETWISHPDIQIGAWAIAVLLDNLDNVPDDPKITGALVRWYKQRDLHKNLTVLGIAISGLSRLNYFTPKDIPDLVKIYTADLDSTGAYTGPEISALALDIFDQMPEETRAHMVKSLTGDVNTDWEILKVLDKKRYFWQTLIEISTKKRFSKEYAVKAVIRQQGRSVPDELLLSHLKTHPAEPFAIFALSMSQKAKKQAELWRALYDIYSKKDLSNDHNMLIYSCALSGLYDKKKPRSAEVLAGEYFLITLWNKVRSGSDDLYIGLQPHSSLDFILKNFTLLSHKNEWVRRHALGVIWGNAKYPVKINLTRQNIDDLLALQKSANPVIRGYAVFLLFRFQEQLPEIRLKALFPDLAFFMTNKFRTRFPVEFMRLFYAHRDQHTAFFKKCFSIRHPNAAKNCFNLLSKNLESYPEISPLVPQIMEHARKGGREVRRSAFEILCKRAFENKKRVFPFFKKILRPSIRLSEDLKELKMKIDLLTQVVYLGENGKELLPELTRLYKALERGPELNKTPPGYKLWPERRASNRLYQLYDLKVSLANALILFPENEAYTKKSLYFLWNTQRKENLSNSFWPAWRKHPVTLVRANE